MPTLEIVIKAWTTCAVILSPLVQLANCAVKAGQAFIEFTLTRQAALGPRSFDFARVSFWRSQPRNDFQTCHHVCSDFQTFRRHPWCSHINLRGTQDKDPSGRTCWFSRTATNLPTYLAKLLRAQAKVREFSLFSTTMIPISDFNKSARENTGHRFFKKTGHGEKQFPVKFLHWNCGSNLSICMFLCDFLSWVPLD